MNLHFRTRDLELGQALDEVFLRLALMGLRVLQGLLCVPMVGFVAALISGLSNADEAIPSKASAALAVACVGTLYVAATLLPVVFGGPLFFTVAAIIDVLFVAAWSSLIGVWEADATGTCKAFESKYFDHKPWKSYYATDCSLVKATFAFMVVNLAAFVTSAVIAFCLRMIELQHTMSWRDFPLMSKYGGDRQRRHCACCVHNKSNPSPGSSVSGERLTSPV